MSRIFWDTNLFIYLLENNPTFMPYVENLRIRMLSRGDQLLTSTITLGEVLIKPTQIGDSERCRKYERGDPVFRASHSFRSNGGRDIMLQSNPTVQ